MRRPGKDLRIGDPEREHAITLLGEHMSAGRLDVHEYDQRCAKIAAARFTSEVLSVFEDLPEPVPRVASAPSRPPASARKVVLLACAAVAVVLLSFVAKPFAVLLLVGLAAILWFGRRGGSQ